MTATLAARLDHVFWIGGGSGAGKSAIARRLADEHGLRLYATDDVMADHARRAPPEDSPALTQFAATDMDERWVNRSPEQMVETFHWFRGEAFDLIVEDLLALGDDRPVVAEGFRLLPALVAPLLASPPTHALWLLPTPDFRRAALARRGSLWEIAKRTSDPERALHNLLERDRMFTDVLRRETARLGLHALAVDGSSSEEDVADEVRGALGL